MHGLPGGRSCCDFLNDDFVDWSSVVGSCQSWCTCLCMSWFSVCVHRLLVVYNCVFVLGRQCVVDDWPSTDWGCPVMCFFGGSEALSADELLPSNWLGSVFQKIWAGLDR